MSEFDLELARSRVEGILRVGRRKIFKKLIVPVSAHLGSIVTISVAWFMRTGSFQFSTDYWADWVIAGFLVFVACSGVRIVLDNVTVQREMTVNRAELTDLLSIARADAELSVLNIGGDLSWLQDDFLALSAVRRFKPELKFRIYYDRSRVSGKMTQLIADTYSLGIDLIPYPHPVSPSIRCMLVDREVRDNCRVYVYSHARIPTVGEPRNKHLFLWQVFGPESLFIMEGLSALVETLEATQTHPIRIGISGLNNVGKTQLSTKLRDTLDGKYRVKLFPDQFRISGSGTTVEDNYIILFSQLMNEANGSADICIFDRTVVDNLCFLRLRSGNNNKVYQALAPKIANFIKNYDLIVHVRKSEEDFTHDSTRVTGAHRKFVGDVLDEFFSTYAIPTREIVLDVVNFHTSLEQATQDLAEEVEQIHHRKRVSE